MSKFIVALVLAVCIFGCKAQPEKVPDKAHACYYVGGSVVCY